VKSTFSFFFGGREGKLGFVLRLVLEGGVQVEGKHETVNLFFKGCLFWTF